MTGSQLPLAGVDDSASPATGLAHPAPLVELRIYSRPAPQGSKRPVRAGNGRLRTVESSKRVAPWRQDVSDAAQRFVEAWEQANGVVVHGSLIPRAWAALDGPLVASMVFTVAKPKSAPKRRRTWPQSAPDLSKLLRSTEDALTTAGIWHDDARVVEYVRLAKVFPGEDPDALRSPGALVRIWTMTAWRGEDRG